MPCPTCPLKPSARREQDVLALLAQGRQTAAIADALCLSVKTVETYYQRLKQKLGVANLHELIVYAARHPQATPSPERPRPWGRPHPQWLERFAATLHEKGQQCAQ